MPRKELLVRVVALQSLGRGFGRERVGGLLLVVHRASARIPVADPGFARGACPALALLALAKFARLLAVFASFACQGYSSW
ncbi:hypothetical protein HYW17_00450 [Candidatus Uhrbacteria bacterium]|nr:hypothetical protein [Candidatus Uhrbacteria bacterium]